MEALLAKKQEITGTIKTLNEQLTKIDADLKPVAVEAFAALAKKTQWFDTWQVWDKSLSAYRVFATKAAAEAYAAKSKANPEVIYLSKNTYTLQLEADAGSLHPE